MMPNGHLLIHPLLDPAPVPASVFFKIPPSPAQGMHGCILTATHANTKCVEGREVLNVMQKVGMLHYARAATSASTLIIC